MEADEVKMYLDRMVELKGHIEDIRYKFGRCPLLDLETMGCLETLLNTMDEYDGWWADLEVPMPKSEIELLELMILGNWHPDKEWPDESFCDELVYEVVEGFARMVLETAKPGGIELGDERPCALCGKPTNTPDACFECYHQPYGVGWQEEFAQGGKY